MLPISGHWDLPVGPFASEVYAHASNDRGLVLQTEGGEVEAAGWGEDKRGRERRENRQRLGCSCIRYILIAAGGHYLITVAEHNVKLFKGKLDIMAVVRPQL